MTDHTCKKWAAVSKNGDIFIAAENSRRGAIREARQQYTTDEEIKDNTDYPFELSWTDAKKAGWRFLMATVTVRA